MNTIFQKPKNVRYVDMAIWIDNNFYTDDCDINLAFKYMYLLAYMLASKARYFNRSEDYDEYAFFLAKSTYNRMANPDKKKVKSVLNYMKSIMYFRKNAFQRETFSQIIDPEFNTSWDGGLFRENELFTMDYNENYILRTCVIDTLRSIPRLMKQAIPDTFKSDKLLYSNIYKSAILSFLNRVTLPKNKEDFFVEQKSNVRFNTDNYITKQFDNDTIILWHLPKGMEDAVRYVINKSKQLIVKEVNETIDEFRISDKQFDDIQKNELELGDDS